MMRLLTKEGFEIVRGRHVNFYLSIGKGSSGEYYYPLSDFLQHKNKIHNLLRIISIPIRLVPVLRDSVEVIVKK